MIAGTPDAGQGRVGCLSTKEKRRTIITTVTSSQARTWHSRRRKKGEGRVPQGVNRSPRKKQRTTITTVTPSRHGAAVEAASLAGRAVDVLLRA